MTTNGFVTVWSDKGRYIYQAHIYTKLRVMAENGGAVYQNEMTVRIPSKEDINISCGDYMAEGRFDGEKPQDKKKIVSVIVNKSGLNPHYRVVAV